MLNHENLIQALIKHNQVSIQTLVIKLKKIKQHHTTILNIKYHHNSLN